MFLMFNLFNYIYYQYAEAAKLLLVENGKALCSTIDENEAFMKELLNVDKKSFRPSIPNLVYQYSFYANYDSEALSSKNPETPEF